MHTFPGPSPMDWLSRIPSCVVQTHIDALPVIDAGVSLDMVTRMAVGSGHVSAEEATRRMRHWELIANGENPETVKPRANPGAFARTGLKVRLVKRRKPD